MTVSDEEKLEQLRRSMQAVKYILKQHMRDLALIHEYLRTKRPIDFRDYETWCEKQSALWDAAEKRAEERLLLLEEESG